MKKNYFNRSQIKKISNTNLHFFSQSFVYCAPLSLPETYYQKWRNILLVACTTFPPTFEKTSFQPKMKKKNTSNNKTRHKSFLESVSISWNQKWFSETTTEWCSCEKKKKSGFYHVGLVFFRIFLMIFCLLNKEQSFNEIWILLIC